LSGKEAEMTSDQVRHAEYFAKRLGSLNSTMAPELHRMGAELGCHLSHNMSLSTLRTALADKLAEQDMEAYKARTHAVMSAVGKAALLTPNPVG
jgi:hypothetical protein